MRDPVASSPRPALPWREVVVAALATWLASRVGLVLFTVFHSALSSSQPQGVGALAASWVQWDARWYIEIAHDAYTTGVINGPVFCPCDGGAATRFFPLYPMLVGSVNVLLGGHQLVLSGLLVSNLALLAGLVGVGLVFAGEFPGRSPQVVLLMVVAYPLAFVMATSYSEATFMAEVAFCLLALRREHWRLAALAAFLAALTRPSAVALSLPIAWEFARRQGWLPGEPRQEPRPPRTRAILDGVILGAALPAGYGLFMLFLGRRFGDPLIGNRYHELLNGQHFVYPWLVVARMASGFAGVAPEWLAMRAVDLGAVAGVAALTFWGRRDLPVSFILYVAALLAIHLSLPNVEFFGGDIIAGAGRYMTAAIPAFLVLGRRLEPRSYWLTAVVCSGWLLQAALLVRYFSEAYVE